MADAVDSKSTGGDIVRVQVPSPALYNIIKTGSLNQEPVFYFNRNLKYKPAVTILRNPFIDNK